MTLPRGVALLRIQTDPTHRYVEVSPRLRPDQERAARIFACALAQHGSPVVVVTYAELLALLQDAAA